MVREWRAVVGSPAPREQEKPMLDVLVHVEAKRIPVTRSWVNLDCGLKTHTRTEVVRALQDLESTAQRLLMRAAQRDWGPEPFTRYSVAHCSPGAPGRRGCDRQHGREAFGAL